MRASSMERYPEYAGEHDGEHLFVTPSWSGKIDPSTGMTEVYEIKVMPGLWTVRCNCFGANRHRLYTDILHPGDNAGCKHSRSVARFIKAHLKSQQDTP